MQNSEVYFPIANILFLHIYWCCHCCTVLFLWTTCYVSTDSVFLKFVRHNFKVCVMSMFVTIDSQTACYTEHVVIFMTFLFTRCLFLAPVTH